MWIVCITSVRHVLTVNGYGGRQTKENEKSWCFKGWETLVNKYRDNLEGFFRLRDNSNVNKDLLTLAKLAGLSKNISFHTARHTNATLLIYNGVNITTVQKLLGHKSVKTTQVYTNIMDMTIIHDLEKMKQATPFAGK